MQKLKGGGRLRKNKIKSAKKIGKEEKGEKEKSNNSQLSSVQIQI